jgi:hypothetical protein
VREIREFLSPFTDIGVVDLRLRWGINESDVAAANGPVASAGNVISTGLFPQDHTWAHIIERTPIGDWTLIVDGASSNLFRDGKVDDILFVVTYAAELPAWV